MTKNEIIAKVKALNLPTNSYIVFGSCPMAVAGLRESSDIDLFASDKVLASLKETGWEQSDEGDKPLVHDVFDAHDNWNFGPSYNPTLEYLLATADVVDGVPFVSLAEVKKWKTIMGRPKDMQDIKLIDNYLAQQ